MREEQREWRLRNPDLVRAQTLRKLARDRADPERHARRKKYMREWTAKNKERLKRLNGQKQRNRYLLAEYDLTQAQYEAMVESQSGKCAICQRASARRLHVDHRHSDGKVRGLLCGNCNRAIGQMDDDTWSSTLDLP